ncbi:MarR family winged helix-turn-helix transcriptional regulator [Flavivirga sp. 57AJ16]|uniref:MarR family winged helix-turn-helix transcriptional regulator n=1 Tax=Flavivirga sp. 57AJ16 TaxID=3025307 RepID=UPI002365AFD8|nr:MarR family transcriptional regulator [Flavivirga sp. 57AJ16]MDD7886937.1 MarR family transcriptional regulator [Flavivirga sp. 57AJ16]
MDDLAFEIRKLSEMYAFTSLQMHETIGRKAGLTGTDHKYLGFIMKKGKMTAGEISILTGLTSGSVTALIDRFEKKKLVKREHAKDDRRKVFVVPNSEKIMKLFEPLYREFRKETENLISSFSNDEKKILQSYFSKAIDVMNKTTCQINNKK